MRKISPHWSLIFRKKRIKLLNGDLRFKLFLLEGAKKPGNHLTSFLAIKLNPKSEEQHNAIYHNVLVLVNEVEFGLLVLLKL